MLYSFGVVKCVVARKYRVCCKSCNTREFIGIISKNRERNMALSDQTLYCRDCNQEFVFTVGEQEFYASHNLTNQPTRCPSCRAARKAQSGGGYSSGRGSGSREPRQMYTAI